MTRIPSTVADGRPAMPASVLIAVVAAVLNVFFAGSALARESLEDFPCLTSVVEANSADRSLGQKEERSLEISQPCSLHPDLVTLERRCTASGGTEDACAWLAALRLLTAGRSAAADQGLAETFELSMPAATRLRLAAQEWLPLVSDEKSCAFESMRPLIDAMLEAQSDARLESALVQLRLQGLSQAAATVALSGKASKSGSHLEPDPGRARALEALVALIAPIDAVAEAAHLSGRMPELASQPNLPTLEAWPPSLTPMVGPLEAVDQALSVTLKESAEAFLDAVEEVAGGLSSADAAVVWVRSGIGLTLSGRLEAGAVALHLAEDLFEEAERHKESSSASKRTARRYGALFRSILSRHFQLPGEAARIVRKALEGATSLERLWLKTAVCAPMTAAEIPLAKKRSAALQAEMLEKALDGAFAEADIQGFMEATILVMPGLASSSPRTSPTILAPLPPSSPSRLEVAEAVLIGDFARALERWQRVTLDSRHAEHLMWPALMAAASVARGQIEGARRALERGIAHVEQGLAEQRSVEVSRSTIDQVLARFYAPAVELAMLEGDVDGAFDYAERGRSFTLRRLLGAEELRSTTPSHGVSEPSCEEHELERLLVEAVLRPSAVDVNWLRSRFEAARWRRLLVDTPQMPVPEPVSLRVVQHEWLARDEVLVAYFPGVEKLWIWAIGRQKIATASVPWGVEVEAEIRDAVKSLLSSASVVGPRGAKPWPPPRGDRAPERLYRSLLEPIAEILQSASRLIIVPHGVLHRVPFAALRSPRGPLVATHEITFLPSAGLLEARRRNPSDLEEVR